MSDRVAELEAENARLRAELEDVRRQLEEVSERAQQDQAQFYRRRSRVERTRSELETFRDRLLQHKEELHSHGPGGWMIGTPSSNGPLGYFDELDEAIDQAWELADKHGLPHRLVLFPAYKAKPKRWRTAVRSGATVDFTQQGATVLHGQGDDFIEGVVEEALAL